MTVSGTTQLAYAIPEIWSGTMYPELRNSLILGSIFERAYEGSIKNVGDTVKVNTLVAPEGEVLTDDTSVFTSEAITLTQNSIVVNSRAVASFDITDLAQMQSIPFQNEAKEALLYSIAKQIESAIIAALVPSASAPDHDIAPASASSMAVADLGSLSRLLSIAKVPRSNRHLCLDPNYYSDLLALTNITSKDFVAGYNGQEGVVDRYMGFTILEHNLFGTDIGYALHPSALQLVMQKEPTIKISDMHSQHKFGYVISADLVFGLSLFDNTRIVKISG